ncbi:hypothetical protein BDV28DRAFT_151807 [Aspergillus coremiiformis]|uniref:SDR family NAD(P)-dependent oxidoreductase n=1 Tax=Aspergillus coremiiformis TaxID=138285 RepID=A0A5N6YVP9_9EURO|nr:hypothetical protein BDV28DRAFT_151807 [Aspergillus coremiiformis]
MAFPYRHFLLVGATSGIGRAMADRLIANGAKVTAVGRRQERLDEFVRQHGEDKAQAMAFDIGKTEQAPQFAKDVFTKYPDIGCLQAGKDQVIVGQLTFHEIMNKRRVLFEDLAKLFGPV